MMLILAILCIVPIASADYECLCNNHVEAPVYASPSTSSAEIGYLYQFDCKPLEEIHRVPSDDFIVVQFEKKVLNLLQSSPCLRALLLYKPLVCTASSVLTVLQPDYASEGSPRRGMEELVMVQLTDFLTNAEAGELLDIIPEENVDSVEMERFIQNVKPVHVLEYATGANQVPACGFVLQPSIKFVHDDNKFLPAANTCSYELLLFINAATATNAFSTYLTKALMNGVVFSTL